MRVYPPSLTSSLGKFLFFKGFFWQDNNPSGQSERARLTARDWAPLTPFNFSYVIDYPLFL